MINFLILLGYALTRLFRSRAWLQADILVLRHHLNILQRKSAQKAAREPPHFEQQSAGPNSRDAVEEGLCNAIKSSDIETSYCERRFQHNSCAQARSNGL
jgi:hypothetical protein